MINYPQTVTATGIIPCCIISDHDAIYACVSVRLPRFLKRFNPEDICVKATLPLPVVHDPDEHLIGDPQFRDPRVYSRADNSGV